MYCTPCARLIRSITPNTKVSPAAIRNSSTPSCRPFKACTSRRCTRLLERALLRERVAVVLEHLLAQFGLELPVRPLRDLDQVEVLDRVAVGVEAEPAPRRLDVRGPQRLLQLVAVAR